MQLNAKERRLFFNGPCLDELSMCQAMCCRQWDVNLSLEEVQSNKYQLESICFVTKKECESPEKECLNRSYRLKKKENGDCLYLGEDSKCSIYNERPKVCRDFTCKDGWRLADVVRPSDSKEDFDQKRAENVAAKLKGDMRFVLNPFNQKAEIFYSPKKEEIVAVVERPDKCCLVTSRFPFPHFKFTSNQLAAFLDLFDGKNNLDKVLSGFNAQFNLDLPVKVFYLLISSLLSKGIIVFKS
ncbi:MAG: YkgJ family cysteine cluster protein [Candidatus Saganbacteria bacterium]|nr:YkgJ family cysteine cluster protein [Candidatus Saganbacteria bacterium]